MNRQRHRSLPDALLNPRKRHSHDGRRPPPAWGRPDCTVVTEVPLPIAPKGCTRRKEWSPLAAAKGTRRSPPAAARKGATAARTPPPKIPLLRRDARMNQEKRRKTRYRVLSLRGGIQSSPEPAYWPMLPGRINCG